MNIPFFNLWLAVSVTTASETEQYFTVERISSSQFFIYEKPEVKSNNPVYMYRYIWKSPSILISTPCL